MQINTEKENNLPNRAIIEIVSPYEYIASRFSFHDLSILEMCPHRGRGTELLTQSSN